MTLTSKGFVLGCLWLVGSTFSSFAAAQLSLVPANPTPLDTVRLRWAHVGCTNPDSTRTMMQANQVFVSTDRTFQVDCGTIQGYFDEYTVGRLPAGEYDVQLAVNPPPPTLGPSQLIGTIHFTVAALVIRDRPRLFPQNPLLEKQLWSVPYFSSKGAILIFQKHIRK